MFQNPHTDQLDFSKLMFYKFFLSLASIGDFPVYNVWGDWGKSNCSISGRKCCNINPNMNSRKGSIPSKKQCNSSSSNQSQSGAGIKKNNKEEDLEQYYIQLEQYITKLDKEIQGENERASFSQLLERIKPLHLKNQIDKIIRFLDRLSTTSINPDTKILYKTKLSSLLAKIIKQVEQSHTDIPGDLNDRIQDNNEIDEQIKKHKEAQKELELSPEEHEQLKKLKEKQQSGHEELTPEEHSQLENLKKKKKIHNYINRDKIKNQLDEDKKTLSKNQEHINKLNEKKKKAEQSNDSEKIKSIEHSIKALHTQQNHLNNKIRTHEINIKSAETMKNHADIKKHETHQSNIEALEANKRLNTARKHLEEGPKSEHEKAKLKKEYKQVEKEYAAKNQKAEKIETDMEAIKTRNKEAKIEYHNSEKALAKNNAKMAAIQAKIKHEEVKHFQQNLDKPGAKEHDAKHNEKVTALKEELNKHKEQHETLQAEAKEKKTEFKKANHEKVHAERRARLAKPHHKISSAGFQIAQAEANNLPYLEQALDMPASPSTDTIDFSNYPYKPKFGFKPFNYTQSLDKKLIMHDPLLFATVNEIYDSMDPTTMTFLNKLFTNAIPYINRIKLYILLAEMFPALQLEMEAAFLHMKEMPYLERIYNKRIDDNMKHLMYKYRKEIKQNRTDYEETWKKRKERLKAALQDSSKDKNQQNKN